MPSVKQGEKQDHYMHRCVPLLLKEGKKHDQAVAQCINMFKEHWRAKGNVVPEDEKELQELMATASWDECAECVEKERAITGVWELEITVAKKIIKCDSCKETVDLKKPAKGEPPSEAISATLNAGLTVEGMSTTKEYHFCDEKCLLEFLKKRNKK